jgi:hypothetical protein
MRAPSAGRLTIRPENWPALHQALWQAGLSPDNLDEDDDPPYGCGLSSYTVRNAARGWGRLLAILEATAAGTDTGAVSPSSLVTPKAIRRFIAAMKAEDNGKNTIAARIWELRVALRIMVPAADFRWLTSPGGVDVRTLFHDAVPRRLVQPQSSKELYDWGLAMMDDAASAKTARSPALRYRNGLLIAVFASRAPRLRSAAALQFGTHVVPQDSGYRLKFGPGDMKMGRRLEYDVPQGVVHRILHYLEVERPHLLRGRSHTWFWVGGQGEPLRQSGIEKAIRRLTEAKYGRARGPHSFRYAMGTTAPLMAPRTPAIAAAIMGNSPAVVEKAYNLGNQVVAAMTFQESVEQDRQQSTAIARRFFSR